MSRRRRTTVAVIAATGCVLIALAGASRVRSPQQRIADVAPPDSTTLTEPVIRTVVSRTARFSATVSPRRKFPLASPSPGGIVTRLPVGVGADVHVGTVVAEVAARPVVVVTLAYPLYREIGPGATGDDVAAVQELLRSLQYSTSADPTGTFGRGTEGALRRFYEDRGYSAPTTASPSDDEIRAAAKAVDDAERTLAELPPEQSAGEATAALNDAFREYNDLRARSGIVVAQSELVAVPELPATVLRLAASVGAPLSGPLVELGAGGQILNVEIPAERIGSITTGMSARAQDGSGTLTGKVIDVQSSGRPPDQGGTTSSVPPGQPRAGSAVVEVSEGASLGADAVGRTLNVEIILGESAGPCWPCRPRPSSRAPMAPATCRCWLIHPHQRRG